MRVYLDMTDALGSMLDPEGREMLARRAGETVFLVRWLGEGGAVRRGYASAASAEDARIIVLAHESGCGRPCTGVTARPWGDKERLERWALRRE